MRKIGLLILALIMALGSLGVGYAMWFDDVTVEGTIETGMLVLCIQDYPSYGEVVSCALPGGGYGDKNWSGWVSQSGSISCPPSHKFNSIFCVNKDVAWIEFIPVFDEIPIHHIKELQVIIHNAYPYFLGHVSFEVCNCGNIPIHVGPWIFTQDPSLLIQLNNGAGQLEPGECHEVSFYVGVTQWLNNDPTQELTPQGTDLFFTISLTGYQWNEYPLN
jgi:hypothetical protein